MENRKPSNVGTFNGFLKFQEVFFTKFNKETPQYLQMLYVLDAQHEATRHTRFFRLVEPF